MKVSDRLHGFEVVRISASGMLITWRCATCGHPMQLRPRADPTCMLTHQATHPPPITWPFPLVLDTDGRPASPVWQAATER
jgi:hypothetical protein